MSDSTSNESDERIKEEAAAWGWRRERGLSSAEKSVLEEWLLADSRHGVELARQEAQWNRLDLLLPPVRSRKRRARIIWATFGSLAAAAGIAWLFSGRLAPRASRPALAASVPELAEIEDRTLADGSQIELNRGAQLSVSYSPGQRCVELSQGEAHFKVTKDPQRPFVVTAAGVSVRAVGTAFDVRIEDHAVAVFVTEGRVQVRESSAWAQPPSVAAGEKLVVPLAASSREPTAIPVSAQEMQTELAWQPELLNFAGTPLAEIVREFNRHNPIRMVVDDPELASFKFTARLRSDNVGGFLRMLETGCGIRAERRGDSVILLKKGG